MVQAADHLFAWCSRPRTAREGNLMDYSTLNGACSSPGRLGPLTAVDRRQHRAQGVARPSGRFTASGGAHSRSSAGLIAPRVFAWCSRAGADHG